MVGNYTSDGFRHDAFLHRDDTNGYDESTARFKLHTQPSESLRADFTAMWVDLDNGYDAFSIDNSRTTQSDRPGQDTQIARARQLIKQQVNFPAASGAPDAGDARHLNEITSAMQG